VHKDLIHIISLTQVLKQQLVLRQIMDVMSLVLFIIHLNFSSTLKLLAQLMNSETDVNGNFLYSTISGTANFIAAPS